MGFQGSSASGGHTVLLPGMSCAHCASKITDLGWENFGPLQVYRMGIYSKLKVGEKYVNNTQRIGIFCSFGVFLPCLAFGAVSLFSRGQAVRKIWAHLFYCVFLRVFQKLGGACFKPSTRRTPVFPPGALLHPQTAVPFLRPESHVFEVSQTSMLENSLMSYSVTIWGAQPSARLSGKWGSAGFFRGSEHTLVTLGSCWSWGRLRTKV